MGDATSSFGGDFGIKISDSTTTWPIPITFTCPESGGSYVDPDTGLTVTWKLTEFNGSGSLSN
jgi:hypothetical protein